MESSKNKSTKHLHAALGACFLRHVVPEQRLVAAVSGGLDSVVLVHCLRQVAAHYRFQLSALHVHHGLSGNADIWRDHCRRLCEALNVPLSVEHVVVERDSSDGLEAAARRARHAAFANTAGDWIVLAHHRHDQAETLLFNLLRGTGVRGAGAMRECNGRLLRPFLTVGRADLESFATANKLSWIEDESNSDTRFSRNYLRHEVLPGLERRFPGGTANLAKATQHFAEAQSLLDALACQDLGAVRPEFPLAVSALTALEETRARNVLRYLLQREHVGIPSQERLREAVRQLTKAGADRHPAIAFGRHRLLRRGRKIVLEDDQSG